MGYCRTRKIWRYVDLSFFFGRLFFNFLFCKVLRDGFYIDGQAAIIFFDVTARVTYKNVPTWYRDITRIAGEIPMVLCGNKIDVTTERQVRPKDIIFHRKKGIPYYEISVKSNYNYEKPFLYILRKLAKDPELQLVQQPALPPPDVELDMNEVKKNDEELLAVANETDFPENKDEFSEF